MRGNDRRFQAIVFDMDGTLLVQRIDFAVMRSRLGVPAGESILAWIDHHSEPRKSELYETLIQMELGYALDAELLPGARATIDWVSQSGLKYGILTRNCLAVWEVVQEKCGLHVVGDIQTREGGPAKPDPRCLDPLTLKWKVDPRDTIHVGDYLYDLQLAEAAGMYSILIHPSGENPFDVECDFVAADHVSLLAHLQELTGR